MINLHTSHHTATRPMRLLPCSQWQEQVQRLQCSQKCRPAQTGALAPPFGKQKQVSSSQPGEQFKKKRERENIKVLLFCHKREQEAWTCLPIKILDNPRHSCTNEQFPSQDNWYISKIIKEICHHQKENDSSTTKLTSMEYYGLCVCVCYRSVMSNPMNCSP